MATKHNTFIRKYNNMAVIITVTDWDDFKELENFSVHDNPDFLVGAITTKSIYSNMLPNVVIDTSTPRDITAGTKGVGLAGIITGGCEIGIDGLEDLIGGIWAYKKCGLTHSEELSKPKIAQ